MNIPSKRSGRSPRRPAFSLVLSLTVMAMLLLLCIGGAALLVVQLRIARVSVAKTKARFNAIAGARIAFGEIQRLVGPDQRVTATADILCDPDAGGTPLDISHYKRAAGDTYGGGGRSVVHPRWTGVWNSGRVVTSDGSSDVVPGDETKFIRRDRANGYLQDARFADGKDWAKSRANLAENKRAMGWLVSGNEAIPTISGVTPFTPVRDTDEVIVGGGILGKFFNPSETRSDMLGVRVPAVTIPDTQNGSAGVYAYWVSDEGVKGRANLSDPYEVAGYKPDGQGGPGYFRLMAPQRNNMTAVMPSTDPVQNRWTNYALKAKTGDWANCRGFSDLALADAGVEPVRAKPEETVAANYLHDLSFDSASVLADVVNGGLRRDLTPYLETGQIAAAGSKLMEIMQPSDILDKTPLVADGGLGFFEKSSPVFHSLRSWSDIAPQTFTGKIVPQTGQGWVAPYSTSVPPRADLLFPDYANQGAASVVPVNPVLVAVDLYYAVAYDANENASKFKMLFFPRIVLWNPYDTPMDISGLAVDYAHSTPFHANVNCADPGWGGTALDYNTSGSNSPFMFSFPSMTLKAGESVCFRIGKSGQKLIPGQTVPLIEGDPTDKDYGWVATNQQPALTPNQVQLIEDGYCKQWFSIVEGGGYWTGSYAAKWAPAQQIYLTQGNRILQQIDSEHFSRANLGFWFPTSPQKNFETIANVQIPDRICSKNFRLTWFNDINSMNAGNQTNPDTWGMWTQVKNTEMNGIVSWNVRTTRHTRFPDDMISQPMPTHRWNGGLFQGDNNPLPFNDSQIRSQGSGHYVSPFFANNSGGSNARKVYTIYPVPKRETGLLSIAALQGAPLVPFVWGTSMPVGNALPDPGVPTDRSALGRGDEKQAWPFSFGGWGGAFPGPQAVWPSSRVGENLTIVDWSYELNKALWDSYFFSGIEAGNNGWSNTTWEINTSTPGKRLRNARLEQVDSVGGRGVNNAVRVAASCLLKGGFNVNSTSVNAWISLLSAFRGIPVATSSDGQQNAVSETPYLRNLLPNKGPVRNGNATFDDGAWSGYRSLSDDDIRKLAESIVKQVRTRGPFLGLADFVNRRLKPNPNDSFSTYPTSYYDSTDKVNKWEIDYLGAIQAAIYESGINDRFDETDFFTTMKRATNKGGNATGDPKKVCAIVYFGSKVYQEGANYYFSVIPRAEHLPRHKAAGAPGYLMQADVLQQIGPVLTARSDTFKIRCKGVSDEGAEAIVELVVQRMPGALIPRKAGGDSAAHIPDGITGGDLAGVQRFGRRFVINSFRYVDETEI